MSQVSHSSLNFEALLAELSEALDAVQDGDALEVTKARYLGKSGMVTEALKGLVNLPVEERKEAGGKINKIINDVTLVGQPYVLDTNETVGNVLKKEGAEVIAFHRLVVGEGIEKVVEDYAAEVMKQAGLA